MGVKERLITALGSFGLLYLSLNLLIGLSFISAALIGVFGGAIIYLLLDNCKAAKTRAIIFCSWGMLFIVLVIVASAIKTGFIISPSKIPFSSESITYFLFVSLFIVVSFLTKKRVWCAIACPLGTFTSLVGSFSLLEMRIEKDDCIKCGKCIGICKLGVFTTEGKNADIDSHSSSCSNCGDCMGACPKDCREYYVRGTNFEISHIYIPLVIISVIMVAVLATSILWKPLLDIIFSLL